jgi:serine/threonine protein phosphatase PrpC
LPDIKTYLKTDDDQLLILGCDGIWELHGVEDSVNFIQSSKKKKNIVVEELLDTLIGTSESGGLGLDNMTCIIVNL